MFFSLFLVAHWAGDFVFQTSQMALGKSSSIKWLTLHVLAYTAILLIFAVFALPNDVIIVYTLVNGILHWITDFFTSKLGAHYFKRPRVFYPILGFDQLVHVMTLYITYENLSWLDWGRISIF